jgi:hypothetical protein
VLGGLRRLSSPRRSYLLTSALGLAFAAVAVLVAAGSLAGVDQWSLDHLMPGVTPASRKPSLLGSLVPVFHPEKEHGHVAVAAVNYGIVWIASVGPSVVLVALALLYLWSRDRQRLAFCLGVVFVAVNVVEFVGKALITRPALYAGQGEARLHVLPFDSSFPSGHMMRAVVLIACLAACFPRARPIAFVWLAAVAVMLVVGGWHTPTDVTGGLLIAAWLTLAAFALGTQPKRSHASEETARA